MESIAKQMVRLLENAGCCKAFGVSGGYIFPLWHALEECQTIDVYHCRSETGAAFAAMESSLCQDTPSIVLVTSGPGISNAYTALRTARTDGARVIVLSAITANDEQRPRKAQETEIEWVMASTGESFQYPFSDTLVLRCRNDLSKLSRYLPTALSKTGLCLGLFATISTQNLQIPHLNAHEIRSRNMAVNAAPSGRFDIRDWASYVHNLSLIHI